MMNSDESTVRSSTLLDVDATTYEESSQQENVVELASARKQQRHRYSAEDILFKYSRANPLKWGRKQGVVRLMETSVEGAKIESDQPLRVGDWIDLEPLKRPSPESSVVVNSSLYKGKIASARIVRDISQAYSTIEEPMGSVYIYDIAYAKRGKDRFSYNLFRYNPCITTVLFTLCVLNILYIKWLNIYYFWYSPFLHVYSLTISSYILSRFVLAAFYRPPPDVGLLTDISVVIACKNEEDSIYDTIVCVFQSDYPTDRLELIVVNDGSTDNTLAEMERAKRRYPSIEIINFEKNLGKRHGMAAGARKASGEILVYVDSDSFVQRNTLRKLVQGFDDPEVGAVCGHANVTNAEKSILTKMQQVRYFVAFRIVKAAESLFSTVTCCSGCLAAYRRSYVMEVLDSWLNQSFLGVQATFGDDRSLTNYMLRSYRVIYDCEAVCTTIVPNRYRVFFRQQLRWKKSWIRETFLGSRFMWRRHPMAAFFFYMGAIVPVLAPLVVSNALILPFFVGGSFSYMYIYGVGLMALLFSLVYLGTFRDKLWVFGVAFSLLYMFVLVWQTYYAVWTVRDNKWGTR
ncbi:MAG: glycosyltransferase [Gammaproteobacteria bacterium]|nr:glycosyltransferase [Gammaproteobacteria bacterium]